MSISPIWVICALDEVNFSKLEKKLVRQFNAISENEIKDFNKNVHKWWKISNLSATNSVENQVDTLGHPSDVPAFNAPIGVFDLSKATIVYYGTAKAFIRVFQIAKSLQNLHNGGKFMNGAQVVPYGLCVVTTGEDLSQELKNRMNEFCEEPKPVMSKILFQGDQNKKKGNDLGYDALLDDKDKDYPNHHIHDLSVQIISHLALARDNVSSIQRGERLLTAGVFSLVFEKESEKYRHATTISNGIFERFCVEKDDDRWRNRNDAILTTDIKQNRDWKTVYTDLISEFKGEELKDVYPQSTVISPWTLVSKYMIPLYYNKYIRSFIKILHKNVHDYCTNAYFSFGLALDNGFSKLIKAHAPEKEIKKELLSVWGEENTDGALGIKQCQLLLEETKTFYESQLLAINNMRKGDSPDRKEMFFPGPYDFPLKKLGEFREPFEKFWKKKSRIEKNKISADSYGDNLLKKLTKVLKYHPIPLSLLARSVLTALFLPFAVFILLRIMPDRIIDTHYLEKGVGIWILYGGIFFLCILWGLFKYGKLVLGKIKSLASDYIGWYLYKTQTLMFHDALNKANEYYKRCLLVCDEYAKNLESFVNAEFNPDIKQTEGYEQTMFQCGITDNFDGFDKEKKGPKIVKEGTIAPKATITYKEISRKKQAAKTINYDKESDMEQLYVDLTRSIINMDSEKAVITLLGNGLFPILPYSRDNESSEEKNSNDEVWKQLKRDVFILMQSKIHSSIELCVGNKIVNNIADIAFSVRGGRTETDIKHCNFNGPFVSPLRSNDQLYTNTYIASRFQPSVQLKTTTYASFISLVFPDHDDYGEEKWKECLLDNSFVRSSIFGTKGSTSLASILFVVSIQKIEGINLKK